MNVSQDTKIFVLIISSFQFAVKASHLFPLFLQFNLKLDWGGYQAPNLQYLDHQVDMNSLEMHLQA